MITRVVRHGSGVVRRSRHGRPAVQRPDGDVVHLDRALRFQRWAVALTADPAHRAMTVRQLSLTLFARFQVTSDRTVLPGAVTLAQEAAQYQPPRIMSASPWSVKATRAPTTRSTNACQATSAGAAPTRSSSQRSATDSRWCADAAQRLHPARSGCRSGGDRYQVTGGVAGRR